ncbi:class I SAM-dependent methyltransferase [Burkholderia vietnamiensis]|uniref:class I SAM-dependent methyltransferase n=2 Tax=Burkholderiaceae TaxID=119060 RepID=UPI0005D7AFA6|nr:methyltransferase domain-containing protein [Burkholderia vietnamiensis]AJY07633.1 methyltransferase domain protein [Burkholderia vietnamiensis LMG 10929]
MEKSPDWNETWDRIDVRRQSPLAAGLFAQFLDAGIPAATRPGMTAIEIGCFPGKFIEHVGQKGYAISGIDVYSRVAEVGEWARERGCTIGHFRQVPLADYMAGGFEPFDVVFSLGFIEHFENFCEILYDHAALTKVGGTVLIGAPNFASPTQRALHTVIDRKNIEGHVLDSMYPEVWATFLTALGFDVLHAGPVGGFGFWSETQPETPAAGMLQQLLPAMASSVNQLSAQFNQKEASYIGVIATKRAELPSREHIGKLVHFCTNLGRQLSLRDGRLAAPGIDFLCGLV